MDDKSKNGKKGKKAIIKNVKDMCTDSVIDFTIKFQPMVLGKLISTQESDYLNGVEKALKLYVYKNTTNMYLFNEKEQLKKYNDVYEIINNYYDIRFELYVKRKNYLIKNLKEEVMILSNKARFIKEQCDDVIDLRRKKKDAVINLLKERGYDNKGDDTEYKYLRSMSIEMVEEENYYKLMNTKDAKMKELEKC